MSSKSQKLEVRYVYVKWRANFSYGTEKWRFAEVPVYGEDSVRASVRSYIEEQSDEYTGEHFRSITYHVIKLPPKEWCESHIKYARRSIKDTKQLIARLRQVLTQYE